MEHMTLTKAVLWAFDLLPVGAEFYANQLRNKAAEIFPEAARKYENSILMVLRRHRREYYHYVKKCSLTRKEAERLCEEYTMKGFIARSSPCRKKLKPGRET